MKGHVNNDRAGAWIALNVRMRGTSPSPPCLINKFPFWFSFFFFFWWRIFSVFVDVQVNRKDLIDPSVPLVRNGRALDFSFLLGTLGLFVLAFRNYKCAHTTRNLDRPEKFCPILVFLIFFYISKCLKSLTYVHCGSYIFQLRVLEITFFFHEEEILNGIALSRQTRYELMKLNGSR